MNEQEKALSSFRWFDQQRMLFVAAFVGGAAGIIITRAVGLGVVVAVSVAAIAMAAYIFFGASKKFLLRPDILGDNTYYLGFLFTLVSLAYTLYKYSHNSDEVDRIIQNFGIALSTTLIGLVARVYFNRSQDDPALYENAVRISLAEQSAALIGETAKIRNDVAVLRTSIQQTVNEGLESSLEEYRQRMMGVATTYQEELSASAKEVAVVLQSTLSEFAGGVKQLNDSLKLSSDSYQSAIKGFAETASGLITDLRALAKQISELSSIDESLNQKLLTPLNKLNISLENIENNFANVTAATRASMDTLRTLQNVIENFKGLSTDHINKEQQLFVEQVRQAAEAIGAITSNLGAAISAITNEFGLFPDRLRGFNTAIDDGITSLKERTVESQRMMLEVESTLVELASKLVEGVKSK